MLDYITVSFIRSSEEAATTDDAMRDVGLEAGLRSEIACLDQ